MTVFSSSAIRACGALPCTSPLNSPSIGSPSRAGTYLLAVAMALPFLLLRRARERLLALTLSALLTGGALVAEGSLFVVTRYVG